jgi:hypothetical protein
MRFRFGAKLKQGVLWLLFVTVLSSSLMSAAMILAPQRAAAQLSYGDMRFRYIMTNGGLVIRMYLNDDCGEGDPPGTAAIQFATLDAIDFGATMADFGCMDGGRSLENARGQVVDELREVFAIRVGSENPARGRLIGDGWPSEGVAIDIAHDEIAKAWKRCVDQGRGGTGESAQNCVEREAQEILDDREDRAAEDDGPSCESEGASLSWVLCPLLYLSDSIMRKLDQALVGLLAIPNEYYTDGSLERAWRRMRNIAYVILVPIVLVMVIGTALGFDFVSAYTVKRALPRLVIAAIFIALSFEITSFLVTLTNDVGKGIHGLVISAFTNADTISIASVFSPDGQSDSITGTAIFAGAIYAGGLAIGSLGIILSYIFVAIVSLAIGFFLLSFRQMLIIALMLVAPLAILAWIFPGNDKLWKLWWGTFSKLLMLFPLIMLLIAVGKSFASLVADTDGSFISTLLKLVAYVGPYFMIPATFKFAGGLFATISGMANDRSRGIFDRNKAYRQKRTAENVKRNIANPILNKRADWDRRLRESSSSGGFASRWAKRGASRMISGHDVTAARAALQEEAGKQANLITNNGPDDEFRALTALDGWNMGFERAKRAGLAREEGGKRQYKTLGGKWVDEGYVARASSRWGKDRAMQQEAVSYEMRKATEEGQVEGVAPRYMQLAQDGWGMSGGEAMGAWIGPAFQNANKHLAFKYTRFDPKTGQASVDYSGLAEETYYQRGSYNLSQMHGQTIKALGDGYEHAQGILDDPHAGLGADATDVQIDAAKAKAATTQQRIQDTMETFVSRYESGEVTIPEGPDGEPIRTPSPTEAGAGGARAGTVRTMTQGAAYTAQEVYEQAARVGVLTTDLDPDTRRSSPDPYRGRRQSQ